MVVVVVLFVVVVVVVVCFFVVVVVVVAGAKYVTLSRNSQSTINNKHTSHKHR